MSENLDAYKRALEGFDKVIKRVPADAWENQSPCTEWKARDVAGHVIGGQQMIQSFAEKGELSGAFPSTRELAGDDPVTRWQQARDTSMAALTPSALAKVVQTPLGPMPLDEFLNIIQLDAITHTWDLARATGQEVQLDPDLVHTGLERVRPLDAMLRRPGFFEPAKPCPEGADEQTQLMAFLGREV
jgi:uncharacterized protein (TIGR03086 family)